MHTFHQEFQVFSNHDQRFLSLDLRGRRGFGLGLTTTLSSLQKEALILSGLLRVFMPFLPVLASLFTPSFTHSTSAYRSPAVCPALDSVWGHKAFAHMDLTF